MPVVINEFQVRDEHAHASQYAFLIAVYMKQDRI